MKKEKVRLADVDSELEEKKQTEEFLETGKYTDCFEEMLDGMFEGMKKPIEEKKV